MLSRPPRCTPTATLFPFTALFRSHGWRGYFHLDPNGRLSRRKPGHIAPFVYTGIQLISRRFLDNAPEGPFSTMVLWARAIAAGRRYGLSHMGQWFDVGTPARIATTETALTARCSSERSNSSSLRGAGGDAPLRCLRRPLWIESFGTH